MHPRRTEINYEIRDLLKTQWQIILTQIVALIVQLVCLVSNRLDVWVYPFLLFLVAMILNGIIDKKIHKLRKESMQYVDREDDKNDSEIM